MLQFRYWFEHFSFSNFFKFLNEICSCEFVKLLQIISDTFIYTFSLIDVGIGIRAVVAVLFLCPEKVLQAGFGAWLVEGTVAAVCGEIGVVVGEYFGGFAWIVL